MDEARKWAVEQAIKLHAGHGSFTEKVLEEAEKILEFVRRRDGK